jgi:hypothetical protein
LRLIARRLLPMVNAKDNEALSTWLEINQK